MHLFVFKLLQEKISKNIHYLYKKLLTILVKEAVHMETVVKNTQSTKNYLSKEAKLHYEQ